MTDAAGESDGASPHPDTSFTLPAISRRRLLASSAGLGGALLVGGSVQVARGQDATPMPDHAAQEAADGRLIPGPTEWSPEELVEPEVRHSRNGVLETELHVRYARRDVGGYQTMTRTYEGTVPGPTFRVQPGDVLKISMINELPADMDPMPADMNIPHHFNTTNFHFHGSHVSPEGISDNVFREFAPGTTNPIEIAIPADHPSGTYWYHPHHHGGADIQIASGMAAALIIEGDFADVPEIAAAKERLLVLSQMVFNAWREVEEFETLFPENSTRFFTVNGQRAPIIRMQPGEVQRWRILHAGYQDDFFLELEGHTMHAIARDGVPLAKMSQLVVPPDSGPAATTSPILFAPAQRVDVLVKAGEPGTYKLQAMPYDQGYEAPTGLFATVIVEGDPLPMELPTSLPPVPLKTITDDEITGTRDLTFSRFAPEVDAAGHWQEFTFIVDGKTFDPNRVDHRIALGAVEEWTVTNLEAHNDHVFHIHVNPFQLTKVNGQPLEEPVWLDTAIIPTNGGSITFRSRFTDFTGKYVLHCHMMNHEELGMMQVVEVVDA
ncbi:MAG: multicopper oxidase family protein [Thermomicrobiales bacterium]